MTDFLKTFLAVSLISGTLILPVSRGSHDPAGSSSETLFVFFSRSDEVKQTFIQDPEHLETAQLIQTLFLYF